MVNVMIKITPEFVESKILAEHYWIVPGTTTTVCALVPENGITQTGESSTAHGRTFNEEDGRYYSRLQAFNKVLGAYGMILKDKIFEESKNANATRPD